MNDDELAGTWTTFQPAGLQRQRMEMRVFAWLEACDTPLAVEWLGLFRAAPFSAFGLVAASAASLIMATPVIWLARVLM